METKSMLETILEAIRIHNGNVSQINMDSPTAQESLARYIYDHLMKRHDGNSYTVNDQQMELFSNIDE